MVESSVSSIGRCHPERYRSTNLNWGICIQFDLLYPSWSADDSAILSSKREKTVNGFAWSPRLPPPCEGIQIRNPWNIFAFGIWNLGNFDRGIRVLGFEIRNPRHGIQNLGPSWIPLHGATRRCSHPRCHETGIYWWFYLFGLAASLAMKMPLRKILISLGWKRPEGCLVYHSESTKIQLYNAWTSLAFLYGRSIWKWPRKMRVKIQAFQDGYRRRAGRSVTESAKVGCHS